MASELVVYYPHCRGPFCFDPQEGPGLEDLQQTVYFHAHCNVLFSNWNWVRSLCW